MDTTAAGAAATRGGVSLPLSSSSQPSRKEWRVVSEQMVRNSANEEVERSKMGQSDERLIYEVQHGRESINVDFCSITIDRGLDNNVLQQRLQTVAKQREELQHIEIELRGQLFASSKILELQNTYDAQIHEHVNANIKLQEQLHEMEQKTRELERKIEEKERELHAIRLDNEAAWAKEDLIREQSKELQSYRRERDNSEAERVQHIKQIHDLQEHFQEKEQHFVELQDQHRIAQDTIIFKDEQLREAQAWMTRAREMDALQSTTNHTLQAELHERTEQCNQLWLGCQRQFGEMERLHLHIQQLQLELADARERSGSYSDGSQVSQTNSKDVPIGQNNGGQLEGNGLPSENSGSTLNGNSENVLSSASGGHSSTQADHVHGVPFSPSSLIGMPTFLPTGQMTALHPFVIHQQGLPHSVQSQVTQSPFNSAPTISAIQQWQMHQPDNQHVPMHQHQQTQENSVGTDSNSYREVSENGQSLNSSYLDNNINQELLPGSVVPSPNEEAQLLNNVQVLNSVDKSYDSVQSQQNLVQVSSQFHDSLRLDPIENNKANKEKSVNSVIDNGVENKNPGMELLNPSISASSSEASTPKTNVVVKTGEHFLLDERSLLACIVRTIGSGGRIRISSTLPNRLGKMLAPLHWHDYKKKYGKLDDFVASHPELFVIEGDFIQLREGAQEIIAATAAVAKVAAAAAAAPSSYSSFLPSVTVTPMAQSHRLKKISSLDSSSVNVDKSSLNSSQLSVTPSQNLNGASFNISGVSNVKILSKTKDRVERNNSESKPGRSVSIENGTNSDKNDFFQSKGVSQVRLGASRAIGAASNPRR
ncbi:uncharacterized protein [Henckelia pumila]|uniref:uncharacterized protein isoform X2 n=1 Tax=Henckelia pumila TaxID=405737 RepID=UPI003C6E9E7B